MFIGVMFILLGVVMLLTKMGILDGTFGDYILPIALVALGASFIFKEKKDTK